MPNRRRKKFDLRVPGAVHPGPAPADGPGGERPPWWQTSLDDGLKCYARTVEVAVLFGRRLKVPDGVIQRQVVGAAGLSLALEDFPEVSALHTEGMSRFEFFTQIRFESLFRSCLDEVDRFSGRDEYARERVVCLAQRVVAATLARPFEES